MSRPRPLVLIRALVALGVIGTLGPFPAPAPLAAQDGLDAACTPVTGPVAECYLAATAVRTIQPRIGTALWGGSPVPGTASTLGMRLGSYPRFSLSGRVAVVPTTLPPLTDRSGDDSRTAWLTGGSAQVAIGLLSGFSPVPTVGGVLALDGIVRGSVAMLPTDDGFHDEVVWAWLVGLRLGLLRESFTLPGLSLTGSYGRSTEVAFGDPNGLTDGFWEGGITDFGATLAASKRLGTVSLTAGAAWDRYDSDVRIGYGTSPNPAAPQVVEDVEAETDRWSGFANATWTLLIFSATVEGGWQETPAPEGLPAGVEADGVGWWAGFAFRISI